MPKNKGKGGKGHRRAKTGGEAFRRALLMKEDGQEYAIVTKILGGGYVECDCFDNVVRLGHIRGKMTRRVWIQLGDTVLVGLRDYQDGKADIIHKYTGDEVSNLQSLGEIPIIEDDSKNTERAVDDLSTVVVAQATDLSMDDEPIDFSAI